MLDGYSSVGKRWSKQDMDRLFRMPSTQQRMRTSAMEIAAAKRGITPSEAKHMCNPPRKSGRKAMILRVYRQMVADGRLPPPDLSEAMRDA